MSAHTLNFVTLDVFTSTPYEGNPLALVKIPSSLRTTITQTQKQAIAREFNLSETIFLHEPRNPEVPEWVVDIFMTTKELPFAGHPTIGAACYVLGGEGKGNSLEEGALITKAGSIGISRKQQGAAVVVEAGIPHNVHIHESTFASLGKAIPWPSTSERIREAEGKARFVSIVKGMTFLLVGLETLEELASLEVTPTDAGFPALLDVEDGWNQSFVGRYYYVDLGQGRLRTRMLEVGFEDPATGSAACTLGCYLALVNGEHGKDREVQFEIEQGVELGRRSCIGVNVVVANTESGSRVQSVKLSGSAVQIMEGSLRI